jgi:hypothetical protein
MRSVVMHRNVYLQALLAAQYRQEMRRRASQERLLKGARGRRLATARGMAAWLGGLLVEMGTALERLAATGQQVAREV